MQTKFTMVSVSFRGMKLVIFGNFPIINGKVIVDYSKLIRDHGINLDRGTTISIG